MKHDKYIRIAALAHEGLGITRVKVIFKEDGRNSDGEEAAYFMERNDYREIPLGQEATLADYKAIAAREGNTVDEALELDIYSNK